VTAKNATRGSKQAKKPTARTRAQSKRPLALAGLVVAAILVAAVFGELAVRVIYGPKFRPRPVFGVGDKHLGWRPAPNLDDTFYGPDFSMQIRTDADGYRLGELGNVDYGGNIMVLLGDSYSFGWGLSTNDTFASRLDALIHTSSGARLVNLGVGGYGVLQSVDRFEMFLEAHPDARVRVVVVQHCINDGVDNYRSLGYHTGDWEVEAVERPRSPLHIVNMVRYARLVAEAKKMTPSTAKKLASNAGGEDLMWSYQRRNAVVKLPSHAVIGGQRIHVADATHKDNLTVGSPTRPSSLGSVQREVMIGSFNVLHAYCKQLDATAVHTFIANTPGWYVDEVGALAKASAASIGCKTVVTGIVPENAPIPELVKNRNSAGHFHAEFSRTWAEEVARVLHESNLD